MSSLRHVTWVLILTLLQVSVMAQYCNIIIKQPNTSSNKQIGITRVKIGSAIDNSSADLDKLTYYSTQKINVYRQQQYAISITYGQNSNEQIGAWIDWNNDGKYDSVSEMIFYKPFCPAAGTFDTVFTIPCSTTAGNRRIRIISDDAAASHVYPCSNPLYGDAEEYIISVQKDLNPVANFSLDTPYYTNSPVTFNNTSITSSTAYYQWDYEHKNSYDLSTSHTYSDTGKFVVKLKMTINACDSTVYRYHVDSFHFIYPLHKPVARFFADKNIVYTGDIVNLNDLSMGRPNKWAWKIKPDSVFGQATFTYLPGSIGYIQNPGLKFLLPGVYSVSLSAGNALGFGSSVTKTAYITVGDYAKMCYKDTATAQMGYITDEGGRNEPYVSAANGTSRTCKMLIKPGCATGLSLIFNKFDVSSIKTGSNPGDFLKVYDGTNNKGKALHDSAGYPNGFQNGSGNSAFLPPKLTSLTGAFYLEWTVDDSYVGEGFEAFWQTTSTTSGTKPTASFSVPSTVYINQKVSFNSNTTGSNIKYYWDLDGDGTTDAMTANPSFVYYSSGTYNVILTVANCGGSYTDTEQINVIVPTGPCKADFSTPFTKAYVGDYITFNDLSTQGPYTWKWIVTPVTNTNAIYAFVNNTSDISQNPVIQFLDTGRFTISLTVSNSIGSDKVVKTSYITIVNPYCKPSVQNLLSDVGISGVKLLDQITSVTLFNQYSQAGVDYTAFNYSPTPVLEKGAKYKITINRPSNINTIDARVWIDLNGNGSFQDAGELLVSRKGISATSWSDSFKIPVSGVVTGISRLRVAVGPSGQTFNVCSNNLGGEYEDYSIGIIPDLVPPVIKLIGGDTVLLEYKRPYNDLGATAYDNVDGDISNKVSLTSAINSSVFKTYFVQYDVTDAAGNKAKTVTRVVRMIPDSTRPVITLNGADSVFVQVYNGYKELGAKAVDLVDGVTGVSIGGKVDTSKVGKYLIAYTSQDNVGNSAVKYRKVYVGDTIPPVVKLIGGDTVKIEVLFGFNDPGVTITDNYYKNLKAVRSTNLDSSKIGYYKIYYTVTDGYGNKTTIYRTVHIDDYFKPTITFIFGQTTDSMTWEVNMPFQDPVLVYSDNYYPASKLTVQRVTNPNYRKLGTYVVKYVVSDPSRNVSDTIYLKVTILDTEAPSFTLNGPQFVSLKIGEYYDDPLWSVSDNYDRNVIVDTTVGTFHNTNLPSGFYFRSYQAHDHSNNYSPVYYRYFWIETAGIDPMSLNNSGLELFPNPSNGRINITIDKPFLQGAEMELYNSTGARILEAFSIPSGSKSYSVDLSTMRPGLYLLRLKNGQQEWVRRFVITR